VTLLTEEKRQLMKLLEVEKQRTANATAAAAAAQSSTNGTSNGISVSGPPSVPARRKNTRDACVGFNVVTRDVGVSSVAPRTRTIAVGGSVDQPLSSSWGERSLTTIGRGDSISPTESSSGTLKRRVRTFEAGVQVSDYELLGEQGARESVPVLQIVEQVDCAVQTIPELSTTTTTTTPIASVGVGEKKPMSSFFRVKSTGTQVKVNDGDDGDLEKC
jgi:hypothetical protein